MSKYIIQYQTPWKRHWPLSAGFRLDVFSLGYYRYAGEGDGFQIAILSFELTIQRWPKHLDLSQPMSMTQRLSE
jgi:hypothetical protein